MDRLACTVNGRSELFEAGTTVAGLLAAMGIDSRTVAVEVDLDIIDRDAFAQRVLSAGCAVEIVRFVGGG